MTTNQSQQLIVAGMTPQASEILINNLDPVAIAGAIGTPADQLDTEFITLYVILIDATGSMHPHRHDVIGAFNNAVEALKKAKTASSILMSTWTFNEQATCLHSYIPLDQVPPLNSANYDPNYQTALYDAILSVSYGAVTYAQELMDQGFRVKLVFTVMTDGADVCSQNTAAQVRVVTEAMLKREVFTLCLTAFGCDAQAVARDIGFPVKNILSAQSTGHSIRQAFGESSQTVVQTSQSMVGGGLFQ